MFDELLRSHAGRSGDKVALRAPHARDSAENVSGWRGVTYARLWDGARSAAAHLRNVGVTRGERVALFADNSPEWVLAYLGIHFAGAAVVPLDAQFTERELETLLGFAGCRVMLCSEATRDVAGKALPRTPVRRLISISADSPIFQCVPFERPEPPKPDELMALIFTSGTTGDPKGVCLSLGNIASNVRAILEVGFMREDDNIVCLLPLHHTYPLMTAVLAPLAVGGSVTFCASLRASDILGTMRETEATIVPGVPRLFEGFDRAIAEKVQQLPRWKRRASGFARSLSRGIRRLTGLNAGKLLFRSVHRPFGRRFRFFVSGGARLDAKLAERLLDFGVKVIEGYGLTETSPVVAMNPVRRPRPGSVGLPLPGVEVKIASSRHGGEGVGEILVRGPNVMLGYDRRPGETAAVLRDGWLRTGDLGFLDARGFLRITGRAKEVIVLASGKNVYPEDVERHYKQSPLVRDVCVVPVERADGTVRGLRAVVVPNFDELERRPAHVGCREALRDEIGRLSQSLPSYMRVTELKLVRDELPRTRLGKLRRAEIRRMVFDEVVESAARLTPEDETLLRLDGATRLIARIREIGLVEREIFPADHLDLDLGLDSLARIELDEVLQREFGIVIPSEEIPQVTTVRDILRRLARRGDDPSAW